MGLGLRLLRLPGAEPLLRGAGLDGRRRTARHGAGGPAAGPGQRDVRQLGSLPDAARGAGAGARIRGRRCRRGPRRGGRHQPRILAATLRWLGRRAEPVRDRGRQASHHHRSDAGELPLHVRRRRVAPHLPGRPPGQRPALPQPAARGAPGARSHPGECPERRRAHLRPARAAIPGLQPEQGPEDDRAAGGAGRGRPAEAGNADGGGHARPADGVRERGRPAPRPRAAAAHRGGRALGPGRVQGLDESPSSSPRACCCPWCRASRASCWPSRCRAC